MLLMIGRGRQKRSEQDSDMPWARGLGALKEHQETQWSIVHTRSLSSFAKKLPGNTDSDRQSDPHAIFAGFSARRFTAMNKAKDVISTGDTMVTKVMKVGFSVCGLLTPRRSAAHSPARKYKHLPGHRVA